MSDTDLTPEPSDHAREEPPPPVIDHAPAPAVVVARRRGGTPLPLTLLLTAGLGGGLYWVWSHPKDEQQAPAAAPADPQPAIDAAKAQVTASVGQQMQALSARMDALEKQAAHPPEAPAAAAVASPDAVADISKKLDDMSGRVDALSAKQDSQAAELQKARETAAQKPADTAPPPPDTTAQQVPALIAGQQAADLGGKLDRSLAAQRAASDQALAQQKAAMEQAQAEQKSALDALQQRLAKLEQGSGQADQQSQAQAQAQARSAIEALNGRIGKLEQGAGQVQGVAQNASLAIRIEAAQAALQMGQPLGPLPNAPPALARFATAAPPTESGLRAAFPQVAEAARVASQPDMSHRSFLQRALARVQQSVTVRRGDHVLVGDPASAVLAHAQDAVNAGDLKGAADMLGTLNGPAAAATQDWVSQVRALIDARAALAAMARG